MARAEELEDGHDGRKQGNKACGECGSGDRVVEVLSPPTHAAHRVQRVDPTSASDFDAVYGQRWEIREGRGCRRGRGEMGETSGDAPKQMGHLELAHYPNPCWTFTAREKRGWVQGFDVVFEIRDAAVEKHSARQEAV